MKKYICMLAVMVGAMTVVSCSKDDDAVVEEKTDNLVKVEFLVGAPGSGDETRATIREGYVNEQNPIVDWQSTDKLSFWSDNDHTNRTLTYSQAGKNGNYAKFSGVTTDGSSKYYVLYPQDDNASFDGSLIKAIIPSTQKAVKGSFDPSAAVCTGSAGSTTASVTLDHACAYLKITTTKACSSIVVTAAANETEPSYKLAGTVQIDAKSAGAVIKSFVSGSTSVTLTNGSNTTFEAGTYLIAVASSTTFPGLTAKVNYSDGTSVTKTTTATVQFASGTIYNLGTAPTSQN